MLIRKTGDGTGEMRKIPQRFNSDAWSLRRSGQRRKTQEKYSSHSILFQGEPSKAICARRNEDTSQQGFLRLVSGNMNAAFKENIWKRRGPSGQSLRAGTSPYPPQSQHKPQDKPHPPGSRQQKRKDMASQSLERRKSDTMRQQRSTSL